MEFWNTYKTQIIWVLIILALIAIIFIWGRSQGSKYKPKDVPIPPDLQNPNDPKTYNPAPITDAIFQDLDEVFGVHNSAPYEAAIKLSNSQLAAVYNDWNRRYSQKFDHQTLIQALEGDFSVWNSNFEYTVKDLVLRLKSIPGTQGRFKN